MISKITSFFKKLLGICEHDYCVSHIENLFSTTDVIFIKCNKCDHVDMEYVDFSEINNMA